MRIISLDANKKVISVKNVGDNYVLHEDEIKTQLGELGQIMQEDGIFIDAPVELIEPILTLEEMQAQTLLNTEYLVVMSELNNI